MTPLRQRMIEDMRLRISRRTRLVRTVTIDGRHHSVAFMTVKVLEPVNDPQWRAAVERY